MDWKIKMGFVGPGVAFAGICIAAYIHKTWWHITSNAISDLGAVGVPYNYVLDISFIIAGIITMISSIHMYKIQSSKISKFGFGTFTVSLAFLTMIGIFPEGTTPHFFVSNMFFYLGMTGMLITGCSGFWENTMNKKLALTILIWIPTAGVIAVIFVRYFSGVAPAEFVGAITIVGTYFINLINKA